MSEPQTTAWKPGIDMQGVLVSKDESEGLPAWLRRVAQTPELRMAGRPHVECRPDMLEDAAGQIERLQAALAEAVATIEDYLTYQHDGDPWREDARTMGEMDINEYQRDGRLARAKELLTDG